MFDFWILLNCWYSVLISLFQSANHTPSFKSHIYDQPTCCCVVSNGSSVISAVEFPL